MLGIYFRAPILITGLLLYTYYLTSSPTPMIINVPVADLRASPHQVPTGLTGPALSKDMQGAGLGQISQLLFGEKILAESSLNNPAWLNVIAIEQNDHENNPLRGYIKKTQAMSVPHFLDHNLVITDQSATIDIKLPDHTFKRMPLPFGAKLPGNFLADNNTWHIFFSSKLKGTIKQDIAQETKNFSEKSEFELRKSIVNTAKEFIGTPYVWGGKSMQHENLQDRCIGIDCSNLIQLIFSMHGIEVPRNSRSQQKTAKKIATGKELKPGDIIFFTGTKNDQVSHVMLYAGDNMIIEATGAIDGKNITQARTLPSHLKKHLTVRMISLKKYLGLTKKNLIDSMKLPYGIRTGTTLYMGSFFC